jgi:hypothetical protein
MVMVTVIPILDTDRIAIVNELLALGMERFFLEFIGNPR